MTRMLATSDAAFQDLSENTPCLVPFTTSTSENKNGQTQNPCSCAPGLKPKPKPDRPQETSEGRTQASFNPPTLHNKTFEELEVDHSRCHSRKKTSVEPFKVSNNPREALKKNGFKPP